MFTFTKTHDYLAPGLRSCGWALLVKTQEDRGQLRSARKPVMQLFSLRLSCQLSFLNLNVLPQHKHRTVLRLLTLPYISHFLTFIVTLNCITLGKKMNSLFPGQQTTHNVQLWSPRWQSMSFESPLKDRRIDMSLTTTLEHFKMNLVLPRLQTILARCINGPYRLFIEPLGHFE